MCLSLWIATFGALPCESGPLAFITGQSDDLFNLQVPDMEAAARAAMPPIPDAAPGVAGLGATSAPGRAVAASGNKLVRPRGKRSDGPTPRAQDDQAMLNAVAKWHLILAAAGEQTSIGAQCLGHDMALKKALGQCLELKAASTASKRAGALLMFLGGPASGSWSRSRSTRTFATST